MADILKLTPLSYLIVIGATISNFTMGLLEPTISLYLLDLGVSYSSVGTIIAARFLVIAIASLPLALFASRIGISKILYIAGICTIVAGLLIQYGIGAGAIYWFYFIAGMSQASITGPGVAILSENEGSKRVAAFGLFATTWMIPPALGAGFSTLWFLNRPGEDAVTYSTIFPIVFYTMSFGGILYIVILLVGMKSDNTKPKEIHQRLPVVDQAKILFAPIIVLPFLLLTLSQFMSGVGAGATIPFLPPYLNSLNASSEQISLLVMIMNLSMGIATQFTAPLCQKFGEIKVFAVASLLSVITLVGIVFTTDLALASILYILRGTFANMSVPALQSRTVAYIEASVRSTGSAFSETSRWIGWTMASPISGQIIEDFGYGTSFVFTALIYVLSTFLFVYVLRTKLDLDELRSQGIIINHPSITSNEI